MLVLGCPEGGEAWEPIQASHVRVLEHELSVMVRWPGVFQAFSQPAVEEALRVLEGRVEAQAAGAHPHASHDDDAGGAA